MAGQLLLRVLTVEAGLPYRQFVQDYERVAKDIAREGTDPRIASATVSELTYRRWTNGQIRTLPRHPAPLILERMLGHSARNLFGPVDAAQPPIPGPLPSESEFVLAAQDASAHASDAASLTVPDITLDQLNDDITTLARSYRSTSPREVHARARDLYTLAQNLLERTQRPRQRERLYLATGEAAAVMSAAAFDLGFFAPAVQLARTSVLYGQIIEYGPLQAYATGMLAYFAFWGNRPAEAVRLIRSAQSCGGLGATAITRLSAIEARACAHLGDRESAERALRRSLDPGSSARDELHDDVGGEFDFPTSRLAMCNATTHLLMHDSAGAETNARHALNLLEQDPDGTRSIVVSCKASADLARARLLRSELTGAAEALDPVFEVASEWRCTGITARLLAARTHLAQPPFRNATEAHALDEQIEDFTANAVSRGISASAHLALDG
ncbi:hypothetical protein [Streptomyces luteireticuli]|uniref:DNA-binding protein n=1 Tax=Streptomyces luteireticuli TaxID=173858 RepID=A0ABP3I688_9ACTN